MSEREREIIDINLLPQTLRPAEVTPLQAAGMAIAVAAIIGLLPLSVMANNARNDASSAERQAAESALRLEAVQVELTAARGIRFDTGEAKAQIAALTEKQQTLQNGARPLSHDLPALWGFDLVPPGSRLTRVQESVDGFTVQGIAPGPLEAIAYAQALVERGEFKRASMTSFAPGTAGGEFTIEVAR